MLRVQPKVEAKFKELAAFREKVSVTLNTFESQLVAVQELKSTTYFLQEELDKKPDIRQVRQLQEDVKLMTPRIVTTDLQKEVKLLATIKEMDDATRQINRQLSELTEL